MSFSRTHVMGVALCFLAACGQAEVSTPIAPAEAAQASGTTGATPAEPPPMGDPANNPDMTAFAAEVDADHDGHMSAAEWQAKGLPTSSFSMFEKGRGYVTLEDYQKTAAPAGIDSNGDGVLTVEEFVAFDKKMSAQMQNGQPPAPPPAQ